MTQGELTALERVVVIEARPETIFPFFTDADLWSQWGGVATLDPRPGGIFRSAVNSTHIASGEFVEVEPPHRVVFTWGWEGEESAVPPGSSTVEVTLTPQGEHTSLRLVHRDLPTPEEATAHTAGWDHYLERLQILGTGGDPGPDAWAQEPPEAED
jgi:uncharacterized protein YndB with AHSA1/START domain